MSKRPARIIKSELLRAGLRTPSPAERSRSERSEDPKCPKGTRSPHVHSTGGCEAQDTGGDGQPEGLDKSGSLGRCEATSGRRRRTRPHT